MARLRLLAALAALALPALGATACGGNDTAGAAVKGLRVGVVPNIAPDEVDARYAPLASYLERKLGVPVKLWVPTSYPAVVEALANDRIDLAWFGGLTYVQARQRAKVTPLVTDINPETGTTKYDSRIIVPAGSPVHRLADLRGKTFAFGSISSTSGSLYPSIMLRDAGLDYRHDLGRTIYTGGHDATAAAVASGKVDAGGLEGRVLDQLIDKGVIDRSKVRVIARSAPIEGYPWVARTALPAQLRERIADAFTSMRDPKLLKLLGVDGYARVTPSDYDYVEREAGELGLLTKTG